MLLEQNPAGPLILHVQLTHIYTILSNQPAQTSREINTYSQNVVNPDKEIYLYFSLWEDKMTSAPAIGNTRHLIKQMSHTRPIAENPVKDS